MSCTSQCSQSVMVIASLSLPVHRLVSRCASMIIPMDFDLERSSRLFPRGDDGQTITHVHYITLDPISSSSKSSFAISTAFKGASASSSDTTGSVTSSSTASSRTSTRATSAPASSTHTPKWPWWQIFCLVFALALTIGIGTFIWWRKKKQKAEDARKAAEARVASGSRPHANDEGSSDADTFYDDSLFDSGSDESEDEHRRGKKRNRQSHRKSRRKSFRDSVFSSYGAMKAAAVRAKQVEADKRLQDMVNAETKIESERQHEISRKKEKERKVARRKESLRYDEHRPSPAYTAGSAYPQSTALTPHFRAPKQARLVDRVRQGQTPQYHPHIPPASTLTPMSAAYPSASPSPSQHVPIPPQAKMPTMRRGALQPAPPSRARKDGVDSWADMYTSSPKTRQGTEGQGRWADRLRDRRQG